MVTFEAVIEVPPRDEVTTGGNRLPRRPPLPQLAPRLFPHSYYLQRYTRWKFHTENVSRHGVHEMWTYACFRVIASELISHDKLILREAPIAARSECHLCSHGVALFLCAQSQITAAGADRKEKNLFALLRSVWQFHGRAQFVEHFFPCGGRVRNPPYVRFKSRSEESVLWAVLLKQLSPVW